MEVGFMLDSLCKVADVSKESVFENSDLELSVEVRTLLVGNAVVALLIEEENREVPSAVCLVSVFPGRLDGDVLTG